MKKYLLLVFIISLSMGLFANPKDENFSGKLTVLTQYNEDTHNVHLKWIDNTDSTGYYAYIITSGTSENEDNHLVEGYTYDEKRFSIYNIPNLLNIRTQYSVYKISFSENVDLAEFVIADNNQNQLRVALTWAQIKALLKSKSNNIWKIRRNNIPTNIK